MDMVVVLCRYRYRIGLRAIGGERKLVLKAGEEEGIDC